MSWPNCVTPERSGQRMIFLESFLCCIGKGLLPSDSAAWQPDFSLLVNKQKLWFYAPEAGVLAAIVMT